MLCTWSFVGSWQESLHHPYWHELEMKESTEEKKDGYWKISRQTPGCVSGTLARCRLTLWHWKFSLVLGEPPQPANPPISSPTASHTQWTVSVSPPSLAAPAPRRWGWESITGASLPAPLAAPPRSDPGLPSHLSTPQKPAHEPLSCFQITICAHLRMRASIKMWMDTGPLFCCCSTRSGPVPTKGSQMCSVPPTPSRRECQSSPFMFSWWLNSHESTQ